MAEFGKNIWYMEAGTKGKHKFDTRWKEGIWLGIRDESGEVIIGTSDGIIKCRSVRRKATEEERWNRIQIDEMKGTP